MSEAGGMDGPTTAVEQRLQALLSLLRTEAGRLDEATVERIVRRARIQGSVRDLIRTLNDLVLALSGGFSTLLGPRTRRGQ